MASKSNYIIAIVITVIVALMPYSTVAQYGGGGGGGGGGGTGSFTILSSFITNLSGRNPETNVPDVCYIERMRFELQNDQGTFALTVFKITQPTNIPAAPHDVLCYARITVPTHINMAINNVEIYLKVPKTDLQNRDINSLTLYRFNEVTNKWEGVSTTMLSQDGTNVYYKATTSSLSFFAVSVKKAEVQPPPTVFSKTFNIEGFDIPVTITDGQVKSIEVNINEKSLEIMLSNVDEDAVLTIEIPRAVLDATVDDNDTEFNVIANGKFLEFTETKTDGKRILRINVPANTDMVKIIGTFVIPEFGIIAMMILAVSIAGIIIAARNSIRL